MLWVLWLKTWILWQCFFKSCSLSQWPWYWLNMIHAQCNRMNGATTMILWYDLPRDICGPPVWEDDGEEHGKEDMWMEVVSDWPRGHLPTPETWAELFPALILWILWINSSIFFEKTPSSTCRWHLVSGNACKPTSGWASQRCEYYWHEWLWSSRCGHVCNHCNRGHCQALPKIGTLGWGNGRC